MTDFPSRTELIALRAAAASDARERQVPAELDTLRAALQGGETVEVTWPLDKDSAAAARYLKSPLAALVLLARQGTGGALVIHTRTGDPSEFLAAQPDPRITFVMHLNSEEAAMRWERTDAEPAKRFKSAALLRSAGWEVWACVGPVRLFPGWRDEYGDLAERAAAAGVKHLLVSYPGEDAVDGPRITDITGVKPLAREDGVHFSVPSKQRAEVLSFLRGKHSAAIAAQ